MARLLRAMGAVCLWATCLLVSACVPGEPQLRGNTFTATYKDLAGRVKARVEVNAWDLREGEDLEVAYDMRVSFGRWSRENVRKGVKGVWVVWAGERLFDAGGHYRQMVNVLSSTTLTTTGIPVENNQPLIPSRQIGNFYGSPFDFVEYFPFSEDFGPDELRLRGAWKKRLDETAPPGLYRLTFDIFLDSAKFGPKQWACAPFLGDNNPEFFVSANYNPLFLLSLTKTLHPRWYLPMIQVGRVEKPRIPWILFPDLRVNGSLGVVAGEDESRFAISSRLRYSSRLIMEPGRRSFYPVLPTLFPLAGKPDYVGGAVQSQGEVPHFLDFRAGQVTASVTAPDGSRHDLGSKRFLGKRKGGPVLEGGDYAFDFSQWGKYTIRLAGEIRDLLGRSIEGGGTYEVWVGRWLTFSSSVKPGTNFLTGDRFPAKIEINPPCPAEIAITVDYYPGSDPARKRTQVIRGTANTYGYFLPAAGPETVMFDQPGEYRSEFSASFRAPDGAQWLGHQVSAGVIEGEGSRVALHGMRSSDSGLIDLKQVNAGMQARYALDDESTVGLNLFDMSDCYDHMIPFYSGDTLYITSNYSGFNTVTSYLSLEPRDPALRGDLFRAFQPTPLLTLIDPEGNLKRPDRLFRMNMLLDVTHVLRDDDQADMFPILSRNRHGYQPFSFPESNEVETYAYFSAIRPGFTAFVLTSDSTPLGAYWSTGPNSFGGQINSGGVNGDMPSDIYRATAGLVYKDLVHGKVDYATYAATIVIDPKDTGNNRVRAPGVEPLLRVNGREQWLGLAMAVNEILEVGDRISLGSLVFPAVPAHVEASLLWPDGRVQSVSGEANRIGVFARGIYEVDVPGVYRVRAHAFYQGKTGDAFGSGDGEFNHYVVEKAHPEVLQVDLPPVSAYDVTRVLEIPLRIREGFRDARVTYSVVNPGMIMDEGEFVPRDGAHTFRFIPSQFAMEFTNFDITDFRSGTPRLNDSVFFVFFVEAVSPEGAQVFDVKKVMIRGDRLYYFNPESWKSAGRGQGRPPVRD